jgi:hypothetical protein
MITSWIESAGTNLRDVESACMRSVNGITRPRVVSIWIPMCGNTIIDSVRYSESEGEGRIIDNIPHSNCVSFIRKNSTSRHPVSHRNYKNDKNNTFC